VFWFCRIGRKWTCVICHIVATLGLIIATALTFSAGNKFVSAFPISLKKSLYCCFTIKFILLNSDVRLDFIDSNITLTFLPELMLTVTLEV